MPSQPIVIEAAGMMTGVGLHSEASSAAIRAGLTNFQETRFLDDNGDFIVGSAVPLAEPWRGRDKLLNLLIPPMRECLDHVGSTPTHQIVLALCLAEAERPGRLDGLDESLLSDLEAELKVRFHPESRVLAKGRTAVTQSLLLARAAFERVRVPFCIIAGVDSFLVNDTLTAYLKQHRILTPTHSDGFVPGEAGAAVLCAPLTTSKSGALEVCGIGTGIETATIDSGEPIRGDGLKMAIVIALADAEIGMESLHYRLTDMNGEQYKFREAALALSRSRGMARQDLPLWHPADCIGEIGSAIGPCILAHASAAARKGYAPGEGVLCHLGNDGVERGAIVLRWRTGGVD